MDALAIGLQPFFVWLLRTTVQASLLICLVLLIQWAFRHRLGVRGRYLLWLVVVARLAMPWIPPSHLSVYNLLPHSWLQGFEAALSSHEGGPAHSAMTNSLSTDRSFSRSASSVDGLSKNESTRRMQSREGQTLAGRIIIPLSLLWLVGVCALAGYTVIRNWRLGQRVRRGRLVTDPMVLALLKDCKRMVGTQARVSVIMTDAVDSPSLYGCLKPKLLLPCSISSKRDLQTLRFIFLHELAHLKRRDIFVGGITSVLHILHWFNPLIGYGFKQLHSDRELACDGFVLSLLHPDETSDYGHTIVRQVEGLLTLRRLPTLAGLCGERTHIKQRIVMISRFNRAAYQWSPLAMVLVGLVGCVGLTDRFAGDGAAQAQPEVIQSAELYEAPEALALENRNIKRIYIRHLQSGQYLVANGSSVVCAPEPGEAGLWEAQFDGRFTPNGDMLIFSVSTGRYLSTDAQGNLTVDPLSPNPWARWGRQAGPLGVQVISQEFKHGYLRLDEQGQVSAVPFGRDLASQWDIVQLDSLK